MIVDVVAPKLNPLFKTTVTLESKLRVAPKDGVIVLAPFQIIKLDPAEPVIEDDPLGRFTFPPIPTRERFLPFKSNEFPELI